MPIVSRIDPAEADRTPDPLTGEDESPIAVEVLLFEPERRLLAALPDRLAAILEDPDPASGVVARLFPPAYADAAEERERLRLIGSDLLERRRERLEAFRASLAGGDDLPFATRVQLVGPAVDLWLAVCNELRLLFSTELGIEVSGDLERLFGERGDADEIDPRTPEARRDALALEFLSVLQVQLLAALGVPMHYDESEGNPDSATGEGSE